MKQTKKSAAVPATFIAALAAAALTGCSRGPAEVRRCVDNQGRLLEERYCEDRRYYGSHFYSYPRYVYGGVSDGRVGGYVRNFRLAPRAGAHVVTPSGQSVTRGGFGSSSSGRGAFGFG